MGRSTGREEARAFLKKSIAEEIGRQAPDLQIIETFVRKLRAMDEEDRRAAVVVDLDVERKKRGG